MKKSAGLLIIKDKKILLCHPTNAGWTGTYTIPKGGIEDGETIKKAAIRETSEEVGIIIPESFLTKENVIDYLDKSGNIYKKVYFYVIELDNLPDVLPKNQLQTEEVDWSGFLDYEEASKKIFWRFKPMLDFIK